MKSNIVFIATSLDGYIADSKGGLDWLNIIPNPDQVDMGYESLMARIDGLIMGRNTFETVCSFDVEWPYTKPVFVLSNTLKKIPKEYEGKVELVQGALKDVLAHLNNKGYTQLYIDGGATIQSFLKEDLIDELIITTIPILLGGGVPLFGDLGQAKELELVESKNYLNQIVQSHYKRKR